MKKLSIKQKKIICYSFQLIAGLILAKASYDKFSGQEMTLIIFKSLSIEKTRLVIATVEGLASFLLISNHLPHYGAILGLGTMLGAFIAHISVLGIEVNNDGGMMVMLMVVVIISTITVMYLRRKDLPLIGHTFKKEST